MHETHLVAQTRQIDPVEDLLAYADPARPLAWLRRGDGIVAVGGETVAVRLTEVEAYHGAGTG